MKKIIFVFSLVFLFNSCGKSGVTPQEEERTYVPDDVFEQLLINLGYDDVINDYVNTVNIKNILTLHLTSGVSQDQDDCIQDFTGLDGFSSLHHLKPSVLTIVLVHCLI